MSGVAREAQSTTANKDRDRVKDFVLGRSSLSVASAYRQQHFDWIIRAINRTDDALRCLWLLGLPATKMWPLLHKEAATFLSRVKRPFAKKTSSDAWEFLRQLGDCKVLPALLLLTFWKVCKMRVRTEGRIRAC
jgi:hypothetical protein